MTFQPDKQTLTEWASMNLYDAVMRVRAGLDGSADPIDPAEARVILDAVKARIDGGAWRPTMMPLAARVDADFHLWRFLKAVVAECEERLGEVKP